MGMNTGCGNMYGFVDCTWNTVKGKCPHDCFYCYMKRFPLKEARFDEKEMKTDLKKDNVVFVGSSNDLFYQKYPEFWIKNTLNHCSLFDNIYLFQSKSPSRMLNYKFPKKSILCTTIESNRDYPNLSFVETINNRIKAISVAKDKIHCKSMITIEPILDFDINHLLRLVTFANPDYINIGACTFKKSGLVENILDYNKCKWVLNGDIYESECGGVIAFDLCCQYSESDIKNNHYCIHCGKPIKPEPIKESE